MMGSGNLFNSGTIIDGKYRLVDCIGKGGMGEVYEASHVEIGLPVAIKTLRPEQCSDAEAISRLCQEARLAGTIGHDHICQVTDIGWHHGIPYLVMPLLRGKTLSQLLREGGVDASDLVDILCQILSALSIAHDRNVIHRDLKPSNIFITRVGKQDNFAKLLDFGISKLLVSDADTPTTRTGAVPGTTHYMSPEQAMGAKDIDHRVDIYAVGVILYRGLTGVYPFDGDTNNEILHKIASASFVPPRKIDPSIPRELEQIVLKGMSRDPLKRFRTAKEMRQALEAILVHVGSAVSCRATGITIAGQCSQSNVFAVEVPSGIHRAPHPRHVTRKSRRQITPHAILLVIGVLIGAMVVAAALFFKPAAFPPSPREIVPSDDMTELIPLSSSPAETAAAPRRASDHESAEQAVMDKTTVTPGAADAAFRSACEQASLSSKRAGDTGKFSKARALPRKKQTAATDEALGHISQNKVTGPFGSEITLDYE